MVFKLGKLSAKRVENEKKPGRYGDGGGLWLQVSRYGTKAWLFRYTVHGKAREMGMGALGTIALAEAREKARDARKLLLEGVDPLGAKEARRDAARLDAAKAVTFRWCAAQYIAAHEDTWKNAVHRKQWPSTLSKYVYPVFGDLPVKAIDKGLVLQVLEPVWKQKPETAARLRMRIETVLDWATAKGHREGDNPARWRGHLDKLLAKRSKVKTVKHHPALPYRELPAFMAALRDQPGVAARALEFTILTAARTSEAINAEIGEFDLGERIWTIPAARMKAARDHRSALSNRAVEIVKTALHEGKFIFPGGKAERPLSNMAMLTVLKRMNRADITVHGFRSTFRDWAAEQTAYPGDVAEMALAHTLDNKTEAAYRRGDMLEKRHRLAEDWARFCLGPPPAGDVVPIRGAGHAAG